MDNSLRSLFGGLAIGVAIYIAVVGSIILFMPAPTCPADYHIWAAPHGGLLCVKNGQEFP